MKTSKLLRLTLRSVMILICILSIFLTGCVKELEERSEPYGTSDGTAQDNRVFRKGENYRFVKYKGNVSNYQTCKELNEEVHERLKHLRETKSNLYKSY